jgi:hypothetical protein
MTDEPAEGAYWERAVLRRWLTGERVDIRVVRQQVAALLTMADQVEILRDNYLAYSPMEYPQFHAVGRALDRLYPRDERDAMTKEYPRQRPESPAEGSAEPEAIQYTGDNLQAVRDWLGDAYEKTRGGLQHDDPVVVWFDPAYGIRSGFRPRTGSACVRPGQWLVRGGSGVVMAVTDAEYAEEYRNW